MPPIALLVPVAPVAALLAAMGTVPLAAAAAQGPAAIFVTPAAVEAAAPAGDWATIDAGDLLVIDLGDGGRVTIALAPAFAPAHVANIRRLAAAHWYDGLAIDRVQDGYVVQWGDQEKARPLPHDLPQPLPAEYERPAGGLPLTPLPYPDTFAPRVGLVGPMPAAAAGDSAWAAHCYGVVGVGRDLNPDTGNGAELYAVIGQGPRALDRNMAVVGRVVSGMERLTSLPRGTAAMGFYATAGARVPIAHVRIAADMPATSRPAFQYMRPDSASFAAWLHARANRRDDFYLRPAGAIDLCNALPPVRPAPGS